MDIDLHADLLRGVKEGEGTCGNGDYAAEIAFLECMRAAGNQRRNNIR